MPMSAPSMTLFHNPASPFVRKVRVLLAETGQQDRVALQLCMPTPVNPDVQLVNENPVGKIPALRLPDGTVLHDSRVILDYLDHQHVGNPLIPRDGSARWRRLTLASMADGIMDAAVLVRYETALRKSTGPRGSTNSATRSAAAWRSWKRMRLPNWPATSISPRSAWPAPWVTWISATRTCNGATPTPGLPPGTPKSASAPRCLRHSRPCDCASLVWRGSLLPLGREAPLQSNGSKRPRHTKQLVNPHDQFCSRPLILTQPDHCTASRSNANGSAALRLPTPYQSSLRVSTITVPSRPNSSSEPISSA